MEKDKKERKGVVFFYNWRKAAATLPPEERLAFYEGVIDYSETGRDPELQGVAAALFTMAKPTIDKNNALYENALKGGAPKGNGNTLKKDTPPKDRATLEAYCERKGLEIDTEAFWIYWEGEGWKMGGRTWQKTVRDWATSYTPPTLGKIKRVIEAECLNVDAEAFWDFYNARNWQIDGKPIKNLGALLRKWSSRTNTATWETQKTSIFNGINNRYSDY